MELKHGLGAFYAIQQANGSGLYFNSRSPYEVSLANVTDA